MIYMIFHLDMIATFILLDSKTVYTSMCARLFQQEVSTASVNLNSAHFHWKGCLFPFLYRCFMYYN